MPKINPAELESAALKNPLIYGISYVDLLQNRKWEVDTRLWQEEIYQAVNPYYIEKNPVGQARRFTVMKSTQCGLSTAGLVKMFHFADLWNVRLIYTLPRRQDVTDFVGTRIDPMINASKRLTSKLGQPDSTRAKKIGNSYIFFMELSVEPRMMPADALYVDEVDLSDPKYMATAQNRLDASKWKLNYFFSTPSLPNYGIHGLYLKSDQREWMVKCPHCGHDQVLDWDQNLRYTGLESNPTKVFYGCQACDEELSMQDIQMQGRWVAAKPALSEESIGFHVSQLMTHSAASLWASYHDPQTNRIEFYRKRLGKPLEIGGGVLERQDILQNCFHQYHPTEEKYDGKSSYYMGIDQGNELQLVVGKISPNSNKMKIVHIEVVPFEEGFDKVGKLMNQYNVKLGVIDADPNRHSAMKVVENFPAKLLAADYSSNAKTRITVKKNKRGIRSRVNLGRTFSFDHLYDTIFKGFFSLPGHADSMLPEVDKLIQQVVSIRRDVVEKNRQEGSLDVGVWRALGPDHFAHALVYLKTAYDIDNTGARFRFHIIGEEGEEEEEIDAETAEDEEVYSFNPDGDSDEDEPPKKTTRIRII
jgi:hypothetical protein